MEQLKSDIVSRVIHHTAYLIEHVSVSLDDKRSFIPGGHNGPYIHPETPIRNTCHVIVMINNSIEFIKNDELRSQFSDALNCFLRYLINNLYLLDKQFIHRGLGTDSCNGVIGDAWVIEALSIQNQWIEDEVGFQKNSLLKIIVDRLKFNRKGQFAYRFDALKGKMSADFTFNHQLWLAASIADSLNCIELDDNIVLNFPKKFLNASCQFAFKTRSKGLVNHLYYGSSFKNLINRFFYSKAELLNPSKVDYKERGYHLFNAFAFAKLYLVFPEHEFFSTSSFLNCIKYINSDFIENLDQENNKYGCLYNNYAFELPFIYYAFKGSFSFDMSESEMLLLIKKSLDESWSESEKAFVNNELDIMTHMARVYELSYSMKYFLS